MELKFFNYESCFRYYTQSIESIKQARVKGEVILAKPILLLSVIDAVDNREIVVNKIRLTESLEQRYYALMRRYARGSQFDEPTKIEYPFWHLQSDGFWHLSGVPTPDTMTKSVSHKFLVENVDYAYLDEELWFLIKHPVFRERLRDYIIEHKLPHRDDEDFGLRYVANGLCALLPLLVAS